MFIPSYRARFDDIGTSLAHVVCIDKLSFLNNGDWHHQIWTGAVQKIIEHRQNITELELDFNEWIRPDFLEYMQERREAMSSPISVVPRRLRVFRYIGECERPWSDLMPALNVIPSGIDSLAINSRDLSTCLRELRLESTTIPLDFMWPLNGDGQPIPDSESLWWQYLEKWKAYCIPPWLPSGQWGFLPDYEEQTEIDLIDEINGWDDEEIGRAHV